jgi:hypothetical protein
MSYAFGAGLALARFAIPVPKFDSTTGRQAGWRRASPALRFDEGEEVQGRRSRLKTRESFR